MDFNKIIKTLISPSFVKVMRNIAVSFFLTYVSSQNKNIMNVLYRTLGGEYLFAQIFQSNLKFGIFKSLLPEYCLSEKDRNINRAIKYYYTNYDLYDPIIKANIARQIDISEPYEKSEHDLQSFLELVYHPITKKKVVHNSELEMKIYDLCSPFNKNTTNVIIQFVNWIIFSSNVDKDVPIKKFLYLKGPPGCGKTYTLNKLADILGLPIHKAPNKIKTIHDVFIFYSATESGKLYKNDIIFIDEFDKLKTPVDVWLKLTDFQTKMIDFDDDDGMLDISTKIFVFAGNKSLIEIDPSGGLTSRFGSS